MDGSSSAPVLRSSKNLLHLNLLMQALESEALTMCNLSKGFMEKEIEKGVLSSIKVLMETTGWTGEQPMTALKAPEAERPVHQDLLKSRLKPNAWSQLWSLAFC